MSTNKVSANEVWLGLLSRLVDSGNVVIPRGRPTRELLCVSSVVDMTRPVITSKARNLGYKFMLAEAYWILSGDSRVETIAPYSKAIASFSDSGMYFQGAYGPMVVQQLDYVTEMLLTDNDTRQAVMTIWRPNPRSSKDIPCTVSVQFLIRNKKLYCIDTMRSSDVWLGWPYDVFNFSMLSAFIVLALRQNGLTVDLGQLILTAGSQHLYDTNLVQVNQCLTTANILGSDWEYEPLNVHEFEGPRSILRHLEKLLEHNFSNEGSFLNDLSYSIKTSKNNLAREAGVGNSPSGVGDKYKEPLPGS